MIKSMSTKNAYKKLIKEIQKNDKLYYQDAAPIISDYAYDQLVKEAEEIERLHPEWVESTSPTKNIQTDATGKFKTVTHRHRMLSLTNTYAEEELEAFINRMEKLTEKKNLVFNVELKMDGIALSVIYKNGILERAVTRGDGRKGDDVTNNALAISNLPHKLKGNYDGTLELRGEVYLPLKEFQRLNEEREEKGLELYANPRNAASGSLKLLDANISKTRGLQIVLYDWTNTPSEISMQSQIAPFLKQLGLPVFSSTFTHSAKSSKEILSFAHSIEKKRHSLPFEIDGIVVKVNDLEERVSIGATNKSPRWAVAYKFAAEQAETQIESISVQVGRTGVLTPVANLIPVKLSGSTISRATLHNQDEIDRKDIREKDYVIIEKGGDVIPKVVSVVKKAGKKRSSKWSIPDQCPNCGGSVLQREGEVAIRCAAGAKCSGQYLGRIKHFISKGAMNIENFGVKVMERFHSLGFLETLPDIYRIQEEDLRDLEGFGSRSIEVLLDNIEKSKEPELYRFIFSLGIPYVGIVAAQLIADYVGNVDALIEIEKEELLNLEGIGEKIADSVVEYFSEQNNVDEVEELLELGICPKPPIEKEKNHPFSKKTFVVTGTLEEYGRSEIKELIEKRGGKVTSSVSKLTDYLLLGENPGSKYEKAIKLKVKVLNEKEFIRLL